MKGVQLSDKVGELRATGVTNSGSQSERHMDKESVWLRAQMVQLDLPLLCNRRPSRDAQTQTHTRDGSGVSLQMRSL